jgi:hypothetical protein
MPSVPGVLTAQQVARTAAGIVAVQRPDGSIPWAPTDPRVDVWNHVEAAMALLAGGQVAAAHRAYAWVLRTQRRDGSWPARLADGRVADAGTDTNTCAYLAVGVWHHWLVRGDRGFVERCWPALRRALDLVTSVQLPFGGIAWAVDPAGRSTEEALVAGSASIHHALRAGLALADLVDRPQPEWEIAAGRLGHALREHRGEFADKSAFSMDWYYPVLGGAVRGATAQRVLADHWDRFVVPGLGVRCVDTNPWVTGAETCELALALDALGDRARARALLASIQHTRHRSGLYWTGWVYTDQALWPVEQTTYTAAAVVLAADALAGATGGAGLFRDGPLPVVAELALECGCAGVGSQRVAGGPPPSA